MYVSTTCTYVCALPQRVNCVKMNDEATLILSGEYVIVFVLTYHVQYVHMYSYTRSVLMIMYVFQDSGLVLISV